MGSKGAFLRQPSCGSCFCRSSGKGDERKPGWKVAVPWRLPTGKFSAGGGLRGLAARRRRDGGAGGGMIRDVNGMGMSELGAAASQLQAAAAAPDARI